MLSNFNREIIRFNVQIKYNEKTKSIYTSVAIYILSIHIEINFMDTSSINSVDSRIRESRFSHAYYTVSNFPTTRSGKNIQILLLVEIKSHPYLRDRNLLKSKPIKTTLALRVTKWRALISLCKKFK